MEEKGENVTIPVLSKYKFCLKFIKLGRLTDSPFPPPPPPAVPLVNYVTSPKKVILSSLPSLPSLRR